VAGTAALAFRSLDPFRALREPDRRRRDEEGLSRSEQRTVSKTQNNRLTGKAPYKSAANLTFSIRAPKISCRHQFAPTERSFPHGAPIGRTSNPIESVFATVRHRTVRTKGALSAKAAKLMVFKLVNAAAKNMAGIKGRKPITRIYRACP
jgi:hypothetical protein